MCKECFIALSKKFKDLSEEAEEDGEMEIAEGLADLSLLSFTGTQLKSSTVFNLMLRLLTLAYLDPKKAKAIDKTIDFAMRMIAKENDSSIMKKSL